MASKTLLSLKTDAPSLYLSESEPARTQLHTVRVPQGISIDNPNPKLNPITELTPICRYPNPSNNSNPNPNREVDFSNGYLTVYN